uniref:Large ribosomal subunit protein bL28c n=1 Tax=Sporolithon durum TaxID=48970 RepID=A0A141SCW0_9FLOR|nr:ribosomal protein L28 [Sporolithon durum]AMK96128.1 ribosomal protein L28 [Sporolithon durum]
MPKQCKIMRKCANNGYSISHSHIRTKKIQNVNLQKKKVWSDKKHRWIKLLISTKAIKSIYKIKF